MKRALDVTVALLGLVILAPVFVIIGVWIKATSPGPVLYRARRVGQNGDLFSLYKFRSMVADADRIGAGITAGGFSIPQGWLALAIFWLENFLAHRVPVQPIPEMGEG